MSAFHAPLNVAILNFNLIFQEKQIKMDNLTQENRERVNNLWNEVATI